MKQTLFAIGALISGILLADPLPGWQEARMERVEPGFHASITPAVGMEPETVQMVSAFTELPPADDSELIELAWGLQHDPVRIFNYVKNKVDYTPTYGLMKGPLLTLQGRSGNDWDQAVLLTKLLQLSGYSPSIGHGIMHIPFTDAESGFDMMDWLGVVKGATDYCLSYGGIPHGNSGQVDGYAVNRVWVEVAIEGVTYKLDPTIKRYSRPPATSFSYGYNKSDLLSIAGGTVGADYVQNLNQNALFTHLDSLALNLRDVFRTEPFANKSLDKILGADAIIEEPAEELPQTLPFSVTDAGVWAQIPDEFYHKLSLKHGNLEIPNIKTADLANRRLSVFYTPVQTQQQSAPIEGQMFETIQGVSIPLVSELKKIDITAPQNLVNKELSMEKTSIQTPKLEIKALAESGEGTPIVQLDVQTIPLDFGSIVNDGMQYSEFTIGPIPLPNPPSQWTFEFNMQNNPQTAFYYNAASVLPGWRPSGSISGITVNAPHNFVLYIRMIGDGQTAGVKTGTFILKLKPAGNPNWSDEITYQLTGTVTQLQPQTNTMAFTNSVPESGEYSQYDGRVYDLKGNYTMEVKMQNNGGGTAFRLVEFGYLPMDLVSGTKDFSNYTIPIDLPFIVQFTGEGQTPGLKTGKLTISIKPPGNISWMQIMEYNLSGTVIESPRATIYLDDIPLGTETGLMAPSVFTIDFKHPYTVGDDVNQTSEKMLRRGGTYALPYSFGGDENGLSLNARRRQLLAYKEQGLPDDSREVMTENLNIIGRQYLEECALVEAFEDKLYGIRRITHHRMGYAAQEAGAYVDFPACITGTFCKDVSFDAAYRTVSFFNSMLEHSIWEQTQGNDVQAASTVSLLVKANADGKRVYLANNESQYNAFRASLTDYSQYDLAKFAAYAQAGIGLLLPQSGNVSLGDYQGYGWVGFGNGFALMEIAGGWGAANGGFNGLLGSFENQFIYQVAESIKTLNMSINSSVFNDPICTATGGMLFDNTDLTLGNGGSPARGLAITRNYNSNANNVASPMGWGWKHSYDTQAREISDYMPALGGRAPRDALALFIASQINMDLLDGTPGAKEWMTAALVTQWFSQKLRNNAVAVTWADRAMTFTRHLDGTYEPRPGATSELIKDINNAYALTLRDGTTYTFRNDGFLGSIQDKDNWTIMLSYNAQTNVTQVADHWGHALTFNYTDGRVTSIHDSAGRSIQYGYSPVGDIISFTDPENNTWTYSYDNAHRLVSETNPEGLRTVYNVYDALGRVKQQTNGSGDVWNYHWTDFENKEIDPAGNERIHYFDSQYRPLGESVLPGLRTYIEYDGQDHPVAMWDVDGNVSYAIYDINHNVLTNINALGETTTTVYNERHYPVEITDALGNTTHIEYDAANHPICITDAEGGVTLMEYNEFGLPASVTDPDGGVTLYGYLSNHGFGNPTWILFPDITYVNNAFDERGDLIMTRVMDDNTVYSTTWTDYDNRRLPVAVTAPDNGITSNRYDAVGRLVETVDALGRSTVTTYTPNYKPDTVTLPNGAVIKNYYDALDNLVAVMDSRGGVSSNAFNCLGWRTASWDSYGQRTSYVYDNRGNVIAVTNALGDVVATEYDALNRPFRVTDPLGNVSTSTYNAVGQVVSATDPLNRVRQFAYDATGRNTHIIRPSGATDTFGYSLSGNRTRYTNAEGHSFHTSYDALGRPIAATNAIGKQAFSRSYLATGSIATHENGNGEITGYTYDSCNRLIKETSLADNQVSAFSYDVAGNMLSASNAVSQMSFSYGALNDLTSANMKISSHTFPLNWSRDVGGLVTNITYAVGKDVSRAHDLNGRLTSVTDWLGHTWTFAYDDAGRAIGGTSPGGVSHSVAYDAAGRVSAWNVGDIAGRSITRDAAGQRIRDDITTGPLPSITESRRADYTYDAADRITHATVATAPTKTADETMRIEDFIYSDDGAVASIMSGEATLFSTAYTPQGRLAELDDRIFEYDALGNRVIADGRLWVLNHDDSRKRPIIECQPDGTPIRYYIWGPGRLLGFIDADDNALTVAHSDEYGNIIALTESSGGVSAAVFTAHYGPHGDDWGTTGTNPTPFAWLGGHGVRKIGGEYGLYLTTHRLYSSALNRFLSPDPLGLDGGLNLYAYAENNPMANIDPAGLSAEKFSNSSVVGTAWNIFAGNPVNNLLTQPDFGLSLLSVNIVQAASSAVNPFTMGILSKISSGLDDTVDLAKLINGNNPVYGYIGKGVLAFDICNIGYTAWTAPDGFKTQTAIIETVSWLGGKASGFIFGLGGAGLGFELAGPPGALCLGGVLAVYGNYAGSDYFRGVMNDYYYNRNLQKDAQTTVNVSPIDFNPNNYRPLRY